MVIAGLGVAAGVERQLGPLTAAYVLRVYQKSMTGPVGSGLDAIKDLRGREITALVPIVVLSIFLVRA